MSAPTSTGDHRMNAMSTRLDEHTIALIVCRAPHGALPSVVTLQASSTGRPSTKTRCASRQSPIPSSSSSYGGRVREGAALLQGIATCGRCGRGLRVYYSGGTHARLSLCGRHPRQWQRRVLLRVGGSLSPWPLCTHFVQRRGPDYAVCVHF